MLRDLTTDLLINENLVKQQKRAKENRKTLLKMILLGKRGVMHVHRQAAAFVHVMKSHLKTMMKQLKYTSTTAH